MVKRSNSDIQNAINIGDYAFYNTKMSGSLVLNSGLQTLGERAF